MKHTFTLFFLLVNTAMYSQSTSNPERNSKTKAHDDFRSSSITFTIIPAVNNTWGYDIIVDGKVLIHQTTIPGLAGENGFKDKHTAKKIAELVIRKLKNGEMPPTISLIDLKIIE